MLYLGSDRERQTSDWDESNPKFYVEKGDSQFSEKGTPIEATEAVKLNFSKKFVYYVGSHEGCGCGFRQDGFWMQDEEEIQKTAENQKHLFEYISECLKDENNIEIYACWAGSENEPTQTKRNISVREIVKSDFFFKEDEFLVIES